MNQSMETHEVDQPTGADQLRSFASPRQAVVMLVLATLFLLVANGRYAIPLAAWIAPLLLLRFVRATSTWRASLVAWIVLSGTWAFQFRGMVPLPPLIVVMVATVMGGLQLLPFVLDRILTHRLNNLAGTLLFPCALAGTEYLWAEFGPFGSWSAWAYSQHENLVLLQIMSVTGLYGISFLIGWSAAIANRVWEYQFDWHQVRRGCIVWASTMAAALLFGGARLAFDPGDGPTVRVASVTRPDIKLYPDAETAQRAREDRLTDEETERIRRRADEINEQLLRSSQREAIAGAKIILWGETNALATKEMEPDLFRRCAELARNQRIYLAIGLGTWNKKSPKPLENKIVLFDPKGDIVLNSLKAIPVPGAEAAMSARDDGRIKSVDTPYGRLGAAICFDMDFPGLIREAGRQGVDIMLVPSNDWREIDPWHSHMARFRTLEQGFSLVRHVSGGLSLAADQHGRVLASMDHYTSEDRVLVAQVPTRAVRTVYTRIGDSFAWLCLAVVLFMLVLALRRAPRRDR